MTSPSQDQEMTQEDRPCFDKDQLQQPVNNYDTVSIMSQSEKDQLLLYLHHQDQDSTIRIEDLDESTLLCLLKCIRGTCDFDRIADLFVPELEMNMLSTNSTNPDSVRRNLILGTADSAVQETHHPTLQSPPSLPIALYHQVYASRFATTTQHDSSASNDTTTLNTNMETWQLQILDKLDQQHQAILKCQAQIDALAQLVTALIDSSQLMKPVVSSKDHLLSSSSTTTTTATTPSSPPIPPKMMLLSLLETFISWFFTIPRKLNNFLHSLRIIRFVVHIQKEAQLQNIQFIQFPFLFKILFACFIFSTRVKTFDQVTSPGGIFWAFWKRWRVVLFVTMSMAIYFLKTGIASLLYKLLVQQHILQRIWNDEDLKEEEISLSDDTSKLEHAPRFLRRGQRDRNGMEPNNQDGVLRHDGLVHGPRPNDQDGNVPRHQNDNGRQNNGIVPFIVEALHMPQQLWRALPVQQGFLAGNIQRRNHIRHDDHPQRQLIMLYKEIISDCVYFVGGFFLSLFPTWQPRAYQREAQGQQEQDAEH